MDAAQAKIDLSLVIPLYNESPRLELMETGLREFAGANKKYSYEVVLVNDGSTDDTSERLKAVRERLLADGVGKLDDVRILDLSPNRGKGGALQAGVAEARGNWILTLDADMATSPAEVIGWQEYDDRLDLGQAPDGPCVYMGSREHPDARITDFFHRRIIGRLFNVLVQWISSLEHDDTQCGFKLYSRSAAGLAFDDLHDAGWAHDVEILRRLESEGVPVREMPVRWHAVDRGTIRPFVDGPRMLGAVMKICARQWGGGPKQPGLAWDAGAWAILVVVLLRVVLCFRSYGIAWDEEFYQVYGNHVLRFFATLGRDDGALTYSNLRFYGGLFDAGANWIAHRLPLPIHDSRHLVMGLVGLIGLAGAWRTARLVGGPRAGFLGLCLLALEPSFAGHMPINSKDMAFAAGYIWSVYFLLRCIGRFPNIPNGLVAKTGLAMGLALSIRPGGALLPAYLMLAAVLYFSRPAAFSTHPAGRPRTRLRPLFKSLLRICLIAYVVMLAFWPWALVHPLTGPFRALREVSNFSGWAGPVLLGGKEYHSGSLPLRYLPEYFLVKLPEIVLVGLAVGAVLAWRRLRSRSGSPQVRPPGESGSPEVRPPGGTEPIAICRLFFVCFALLFPLVYAMATRVVTYDTHRHFLFLVPLICVLAGVAYNALWRRASEARRGLVAGIALVLAVLVADVGVSIVRLYPYEYVYYNRLAGGVAGAEGRYELEYWGVSYREAVRLLVSHLERTEPEKFGKENYRVTVFGPRESARPFFPPNFRLSTSVRESDFYISFTRFRGHKVVRGKTVAAVTRGGVELTVVKDLRGVPPQERLPDWWDKLPEDGSDAGFTTPRDGED